MKNENGHFVKNGVRKFIILVIALIVIFYAVIALLAQ
jgi:hypothetical protein